MQRRSPSKVREAWTLLSAKSLRLAENLRLNSRPAFRGQECPGRNRLLQTFYEIEIGESSNVRVDVSLGI